MQEIPIERHPLKPFLPEKAKLLMLGSFPPALKRWSMDFFYPNWINDMWRIVGEVFYHDKEHFIIRNDDGSTTKNFDKERISDFCMTRGIALYDTCFEIRRLKDNASDKYLEVVKATDLEALLEKIPKCTAIVTTGQKATDIIVQTYRCSEPAIGEMTEIITHKGNRLNFWRMPSSSRAYPLSLEKKTEYYRKMYINEKLL